MRLMKYNVLAEHLAGKTLVVADTLSRAPINHQGPEVENLQSDVTAYVDFIEKNWPATHRKLDDIRRATATDTELQRVRQYIQEGWPSTIPDDAAA